MAQSRRIAEIGAEVKKQTQNPVVLYMDDALAAFDKPSGLATSPDRWEKGAPHFMALVRKAMPGEWRNAHRLDRDTSGILLCARTLEAYKSLSGQFLNRTVEKTYLALVRSAPREDRGEIDMPLAHSPSRRGLMTCTPGGKEARTAFEVVERWGPSCAMLRLRPATGRTHQVRVHLAHIGSPVLADPLYGDGRPLLLSEMKPGYKPGRGPELPLMGRAALHAESIAIAHPSTGVRMLLSAPMARDFEIAVKYLARFPGGPRFRRGFGKAR